MGAQGRVSAPVRSFARVYQPFENSEFSSTMLYVSSLARSISPCGRAQSNGNWHMYRLIRPSPFTCGIKSLPSRKKKSYGDCRIVSSCATCLQAKPRGNLITVTIAGSSATPSFAASVAMQSPLHCSRLNRPMVTAQGMPCKTLAASSRYFSPPPGCRLYGLATSAWHIDAFTGGPDFSTTEPNGPCPKPLLLLATKTPSTSTPSTSRPMSRCRLLRFSREAGVISGGDGGFETESQLQRSGKDPPGRFSRRE
mmetsp:Transcript_18689/g.59548  ORF Transcript_18689/g.59548 Transcript_18689/m.59548 type:complete len:253 (-) Transcript_18689:57-815(-)